MISTAATIGHGAASSPRRFLYLATTTTCSPVPLPYFQYFGNRAGAGGFRQGYYSYNFGNWHIIALNSPLHATGGIDQLM
jgi:hypothetical protein